MKIKFNKNFWFGTATSGPQSEGSFDKPNLSIMDYWYNISPNDFHNFVSPRTTSNFYYKYTHDIELMSFLKLNSFRTSIQWSRLIKDFETCEIDEKAVKFYRDYFSKLRKKNINLIVNLYHFDMPIKLQNIGGFENPKVIDMYVMYAKKCFELFGDIVDYWATFNEPIVPIEACYLYQWYYPKIVDFKRAVQAAYGTIVAHAKTVNLFHSMFYNDVNKKITIILNLTPSYPKDNKVENVEAANIRDLLFNKSFLDSVLNGSFDKKLISILKEKNVLPKFSIEELEEIKKSRIDFLGVNYYQPSRIQEKQNKNDMKNMPDDYFDNYDWKDKRINPHRGWEIHPKTIYNIAINLRDNYNNIEWLVTENGIGVEGEEKFKNENGIIIDDYRIDFIKEHLYWLHKAIQEGCNCFGYQLWTFIDCWSWANAYKNRYGIVELELTTQKRIVKKSGYWLKNVIENNNEIIINPNKHING